MVRAIVLSDGASSKLNSAAGAPPNFGRFTTTVRDISTNLPSNKSLKLDPVLS